MRKNKQTSFSKDVEPIALPTDHIELLWRTLMYSVGSFGILFVLKYAF